MVLKYKTVDGKFVNCSQCLRCKHNDMVLGRNIIPEVDRHGLFEESKTVFLYLILVYHS